MSTDPELAERSLDHEQPDDAPHRADCDCDDCPEDVKAWWAKECRFMEERGRVQDRDRMEQYLD